MIRAAVPADTDQVAALAAALAQSFPFSPAAFAASYPALLAAPEACLLVADTAGTAGTGAALAGYLLGFRHLTFFAGGPWAGSRRSWSPRPAAARAPAGR